MKVDRLTSASSPGVLLLVRARLGWRCGLDVTHQSPALPVFSALTVRPIGTWGWGRTDFTSALFLSRHSCVLPGFSVPLVEQQGDFGNQSHRVVFSLFFCLFVCILFVGWLVSSVSYMVSWILATCGIKMATAPNSIYLREISDITVLSLFILLSVMPSRNDSINSLKLLK